jgi:dienelactone hydrolase
MTTVEKVPYDDGGVALEAHLALPHASRAPAIGICHTWAGQGDFERARAERIARELGYAAAALDLYGRGVLGAGPEESAMLMKPFLEDRSLLRRRLLAGIETLRRHPRVDPARIAAIGFCFGGLCALDIARSGADVRAVIAFHGLFGAPGGLDTPPIRAKILVLAGHDDPMATPEQLVGLEKELTSRGADWEVHHYGGTMHAFTNPKANDPSRGTVYSERADRRSWIAMRAFLDEAFAG